MQLYFKADILISKSGIKISVDLLVEAFNDFVNDGNI